MAIPYPQICPDSRIFRPANYAVTQPALLSYIESSTDWSAVGFDIELELGYEDLSESDAASFLVAYEDSRSGFHYLDIGTEPAGGIGNAAYAARITDPGALKWKFLDAPSVDPIGNNRFRVGVRLLGELRSFSSFNFDGITPGANAGTITFNLANACLAPGTGSGPGGQPGGGSGGDPNPEPPPPSPAVPAGILVIGNPYYSLGLTDSDAVESNPSNDICGVQNLIYCEDIGGGTPGIIVASGGSLSRDEQAGDSDFGNYAEIAAFDLDLNHVWRVNVEGLESGIFLYTYQAQSHVSVFPSGKIGRYEQRKTITAERSRIEFVSCNPDGTGVTRHAYHTDYVTNSFFVKGVEYSPTANAVYLLFDGYATLGLLNGSLSASWLYIYEPAAPYEQFFVPGMAPDGSGNIAIAGSAYKTDADGVPSNQLRGVIAIISQAGSVALAKAYSHDSPDKPPDIGADGFQLYAVAYDANGDIIATGNCIRPYPGFPDFGVFSLCVLRIDSSTLNVIDAVSYKINKEYGALNNIARPAIDDDGNIYVTADIYTDSPDVNPYESQITALLKLTPDLVLDGAVYIGAGSGFGYSFGTPCIVGAKIAIPVILDGGPWANPDPGGSYPADGAVVFIDKSAVGFASQGNYTFPSGSSTIGFTVRDLTDLIDTEPIVVTPSSLTLTTTSVTFSDATPLGVASPKEPAYLVLEQQVKPWVYSQSSLYPGATAATYVGMTDGSVYSGGQTVTNTAGESWVQVVFPTLTFISSIDIGSDWYGVLPDQSVWNPFYTTTPQYNTEYTDLYSTLDGINWSLFFPVGAFTGPIKNISVGLGVRGLRLVSRAGSSGYLVVTEFKPIE